MKKQYFFTIITSLLLVCNLSAQGTENFESPALLNQTSFTNNGQAFSIITNEAGPSVYDVETFTNGGWNGTAVDDQFIDNSTGTVTQGDGTSFTIKTTDGADITIKSFYLFVSNRSLTGPGTPTTLTFKGIKDGDTANPVFTITKTSGIVDGSQFTPNNGFTFIDFSVEGGTDNSIENIDEIEISTTNNADYLALDSFTWGLEILSTEDFQLESKPKLFPNPSSNTISISNLQSETDYSISDILGKTIDSGKTTSNDYIDISKLKVGIYFLRLSNNKVIRFIKK